MEIKKLKFSGGGYSLAAGLILSLLLFLTWGISAEAASEVEPNNNGETATVIEVNTDVDGVTDPARDPDFFKFTIDQPGVVSIKFGHDYVSNSDTWKIGLIGSGTITYHSNKHREYGITKFLRNNCYINLFVILVGRIF